MTPATRVTEHSRSSALSASTTNSTPTSFTTGTGLSVYEKLLLPAILTAKHEVILATCFWAPGATLDKLGSTLKQLSSKAFNSLENQRIRVYICLSSRSVIQKLFHTSSSNGYVYPPHTWVKKLGLPPPEELPGLELVVKSLFFRPFSVLHSKYLVVDRRKVFLPSCNISWETWYECCIGFEGDVVQDVFSFWQDVWRPKDLRDLPPPQQCHGSPANGSRISSDRLSERSLQTTLLPHPHNASLGQACWLFSKCNPVPTTPLNQTLLHLIATAKVDVVLLTPNFTSKPVFTALCHALRNGVDVHLITNRRMMMPEQLATAGVLTEQYVNRLVRQYKRGFSGQKMRRDLVELSKPQRTMLSEAPNNEFSDTTQLLRRGILRVSYFVQPRPASITSLNSFTTNHGVASRCAKSHIKLTLIDRQFIVLGSGNMDRASWRTSQELGVLVKDQDEAGQAFGLVCKIWTEVEKGLEGCLETCFDACKTFATPTQSGS